MLFRSRVFLARNIWLPVTRSAETGRGKLACGTFPRPDPCPGNRVLALCSLITREHLEYVHLALLCRGLEPLLLDQEDVERWKRSSRLFFVFGLVHVDF